MSYETEIRRRVLREWEEAQQFCAGNRDMLAGMRYGWVCAMTAMTLGVDNVRMAMHDAVSGKLHCPECEGSGVVPGEDGFPSGHCGCATGKAKAKEMQKAAEAAHDF